jgi:hypothetical protein
MCPATSTVCSTDGSSNFSIDRLTYDTSTGIFSGSLVTNQCPEHAFGPKMGSMSGGGRFTGQCIEQQFPAPAFTADKLPAAAPLRGRVGLSLHGVNIYGPMEAGFSAGQACTRGYGSCDGGVDLNTCENELEQECGTANVDYGMLLDECGGHAMPYHYHKDLACNYAKDSAGGHSPLIGIALDGRGIYGLWEADGRAPTDLDACNGHYGPVPERIIDGVVYPAADWVYHYHTSEDAPYTIGCFGPVSSLDQCLDLYATCRVGFADICTSKGEIHYDLDCPCYRQGSQTYNSDFVVSSTCSACSGSCAGTKLSPMQPIAAPARRPPF